jgi:hypothetical protein
MLDEKICSYCIHWELIGGDPDRGFCIKDINHYFSSGDPPENRIKTAYDACEQFEKISPEQF